MFTHLTKKSSNQKTGPMPVSTTVEASCPDSCAFKFERNEDESIKRDKQGNPLKGKCYARYGHVSMHWAIVSKEERGDAFTAFIEKIKQLPAGSIWRHNQAGDLPGSNLQINGRKLASLVNANKGKKGFTYTHKPVIEQDKRYLEQAPVNFDAICASNRKKIEIANSEGFTVNLSANNLEHADELLKLNIGPVASVLPSDDFPATGSKTPGGKPVVVCPAQVKDNITCKSCGLCQKLNRRFVVGFLPHGSGKNK